MMNRKACAPLGLVLLAWGCGKEKAYEKPLTPVRVETVALHHSNEGARYSGSVDANTRVDLAFRLGGYVERIAGPPGSSRAWQEGDLVPAGAELVRLRQGDYVAKVEQAKSQLAQAQAGLEQAKFALRGADVARTKAKLDFERAGNLFQSRSLTKPDLDGAQAQLDGAQAAYEAAQAQIKLVEAKIAGARAQLDEAEIAIRDSVLHSPIQGVILKKLLEVGSLVGPGTPAFIIADTSTVKVVFGAPDQLLPHLRTGQEITVTTEALPEAVFRGRLTRLAGAADPRSRVFDVEISIANPGLRLKPGMIASLRIPTAKTEADIAVIPLTAVVQSKAGSDAYSVFTLEEQGGRTVAKARSVKLGAALGNGISVNEGVKAGEKVVVTGSTLLHDGDVVRLVP